MIIPNAGKLSWKDMCLMVADSLDFVVKQAATLHLSNPENENESIISEFVYLKESVLNSTGPFLEYDDTIRLQNSILPILIEGNPDIVNQVSNFYNACAYIARQTVYPDIQKSYDPFQLIKSNMDRFITAVWILDETLAKIDPIQPNEMHLYAIFYAIITSNEAIEYPLLENFKKSQKLLKNKVGFDVYNIFSIKKKEKDRHGEFQTDLKILRNSLSHLNFKIEKENNSMKILLNEYSSIPSLRKTLYYQDIVEILNKMKLLYGSLLAILFLMAAFANLRKHYVKLKKCSKCKKGILKVQYDTKGADNMASPEIFTSWKCESCGKIIKQ